MHRVDIATLYPNNYEKHKVQLVANVFNEKVIIACPKLSCMMNHKTGVSRKQSKANFPKNVRVRIKG